ncbi:WD40 repeat-like protein [Histomonas meleagridis]|uniref:WD40 repeat-like protein n=1 Tax=Histomonas meleagridis TaxID=135588 RepID=UPI00355A48CA|nr:WD40 repeat-like protein [Histomonas meleagridis]KAH0805367.1 WD40 repeat-like protein [Histomonas meleagridis]
MEAGEQVYYVSAFEDETDQIAIGCESGKLSINEVETNKPIYSISLSDSINVIRAKTSSVLYTSTEEFVFLIDTRENSQPKVLFKIPSGITDFCIHDNLIAIASYDDDIILSDKRILRKSKQKGVLPSVCTSLTFSDSSHIISGYIDTSVGVWNLSNSQFTNFASTNTTQMNPSVIHCVASNGPSMVAAARQTGLALFYNGKCVADSYFEHEGAVQYVEFAKCFNEPTVVSGASDGSLMVLDWESKKVIDCFTIDNEKVQCITSNSKFIAVADTSDNGNIGIFRPEDFGNEEEEE